jgi:hypothetical protein
VFTPRYAAYRGVKKKILYAFTEAVKVTFYKKKISHRRSWPPHDSKNQILNLVLSKENRIEFVREFESIFKTTLAHESGDPAVPLHKKPRVENLVILSL